MLVMRLIHKIIFVVLLFSPLNGKEAGKTLNASYPFVKQLYFDDPVEKTGVHVEIETERLFLETIKEPDYPAYLKCFEDPEVYRPYGSCCISRQRHRKHFDGLLRDLQKGNPANYYAIRLKNEGAVLEDSEPTIGFVILTYGYDDLMHKTSQAEIAIALLPSFQGKCYGGEAVSGVISAFTRELAEKAGLFKDEFRPDNLQAVWAVVLINNYRSKRLFDKLGFFIAAHEYGCGVVRYKKYIYPKINKLP